MFHTIIAFRRDANLLNIVEIEPHFALQIADRRGEINGDGLPDMVKPSKNVAGTIVFKFEDVLQVMGDDEYRVHVSCRRLLRIEVDQRDLVARYEIQIRDWRDSGIAIDPRALATLLAARR